MDRRIAREKCEEESFENELIEFEVVYWLLFWKHYKCLWCDMKVHCMTRIVHKGQERA